MFCHVTFSPLIFCVFVSYFCVKGIIVVSLCCMRLERTVVMEFREDTNDSWVFAVDETQFAERDDNVMIWDKYHTEGSTDSWIWEVDESQYGGGNGSANTENGDDNAATESGTEMLSETQDSDGVEGASEPDGAEEASEPEYSDGSVTEGERFYTINEVRQVKTKRFRTTATDYVISFKGLEDLDVVRQSLNVRILFEQLLDDITGGMEESDQIRFVLRTNQLDTPISLPFMPVSKLTPERVYSQIERVVQSHQEFRLDQSVTVDVVHVEMPKGKGKRKRSDIDLKGYLKSKGSVITIKNDDDLCLARALVVAVAKASGDKRYKQLVKHDRPVQGKAARELHEKRVYPLVHAVSLR